MPIFGYFAPMGSWIPPALMALWWGGLLVWSQRDPETLFRWRGLWLANPYLWLFGILALCSLGWSLAPFLVWKRAILFFCEILFAVLLLGMARRLPLVRWVGPVTLMLVMAAFAGLVAAGDVALSGHLISWIRFPTDMIPSQKILWTSYGRGGITHAILLVPMLVLAWRGGWRKTAFLTAVIAGGLGLVAIYLNYSGTARAGLPLAVFAGAMVLWLPFLSRLLAPLLVLVIMATPFVIHSLPKDWLYCHSTSIGMSLAHRVIIWEFADSKVWEKPFFGWGLEAGRTIPGGKNKVALPPCQDGQRVFPAPPMALESLPLHPHNSALQIWLNFGLAGVVLAALALWRLVQGGMAQARSRLDKALVTTTTVMIFLVFNISYSLWQSWLIGVSIVAVMLTQAALAASNASTDAGVIGKAGEGTDCGKA